MTNDEIFYQILTYITSDSITELLYLLAKPEFFQAIESSFTAADLLQIKGALDGIIVNQNSNLSLLCLEIGYNPLIPGARRGKLRYAIWRLHNFDTEYFLLRVFFME